MMWFVYISAGFLAGMAAGALAAARLHGDAMNAVAGCLMVLCMSLPAVENETKETGE